MKSDIFSFARLKKVKEKEKKTTQKPFSSWSLTKKPSANAKKKKKKRKKVLPL
jgi:hypothetical protein